MCWCLMTSPQLFFGAGYSRPTARVPKIHGDVLCLNVVVGSDVPHQWQLGEGGHCRQHLHSAADEPKPAVWTWRCAGVCVGLVLPVSLGSDGALGPVGGCRWSSGGRFLLQTQGCRGTQHRERCGMLIAAFSPLRAAR